MEKKLNGRLCRLLHTNDELEMTPGVDETDCTRRRRVPHFETEQMALS